jgi:glucan endo-1,3-alpha-glucosidase
MALANTAPSSLDVTSLGCASAADGAKLRNWVTTYAKHSNQAFYKGKQLVGTFAGEYCYFGVFS